MTNWVEFDPRIRTDRRYESLSPSEYRAWFNLLMFAAGQESQGELLCNRDILAAEAGLGRADDLQPILQRLDDLEIIDIYSDSIEFTNYLTRFGRKE
jgi:hypothetical protein